MEILSNKRFEINEYCGNLLLIYLEEDAVSIAALCEMLDYAGYSYTCQPICASVLQRGDFVKDFCRTIDKCACFAPVMSKWLFCEENRRYCALFWYFIGYMRANSSESIVPLSLTEPHAELGGTPLQGIDVMYDGETFLRTLADKFSGRILRNDYYENRSINHYAARRIYYRCLHLRFKIYEQAFQNAKEYYKEYSSRRVSDEDFDVYLQEKLLCGCRVISFGSEETLEPPMMLYKDEVHPYVADYPRTLVGKKSYSRMSAEKREQTGVRAELLMDILVPVHKLLGVYLKCYLSCQDGDIPVYMLLSLFESDFTGKPPADATGFVSEDNAYWYGVYPEKTYVDEKENRLYFPLGMISGLKELAPDPACGVGNTMDYIYPQ